MPKDTPKRKRKPHENSKTNEVLPTLECITKADTDENGADTVQSLSENHAENGIATSEKEQGNTSYSIEQRTHTQGTERYFSLRCSQIALRLPERENSSKPHVNFTVIGATSRAAVTSSALSGGWEFCKNDNRERKKSGRVKEELFFSPLFFIFRYYFASVEAIAPVCLPLPECRMSYSPQCPSLLNGWHTQTAERLFGVLGSPEMNFVANG